MLLQHNALGVSYVWLNADERMTYVSCDILMGGDSNRAAIMHCALSMLPAC